MAKEKKSMTPLCENVGAKAASAWVGDVIAKKNGNHCTSLCECLNYEKTEHSKSKTSETAIPERVVIMEEEEICTSGSESEEAGDSDLDQGVDDDF